MEVKTEPGIAEVTHAARKERLREHFRRSKSVPTSSPRKMEYDNQDLNFSRGKSTKNVSNEPPKEKPVPSPNLSFFQKTERVIGLCSIV